MTANFKLTEEQIVLLLKDKKEQTFSYLYDRYAGALYGVILREVKNERLSKDILTSSFINILSECNKIDCINPSLFTWMLLITKKTAAAHFKVNIDLRPVALSNSGNVVQSVATIPTYVTLHKTA